MCGFFIKLSSIIPISFPQDTVWCAFAVDNPALRCDNVGFNFVASQSTEPPKPWSLVHIQLFQLHKITVLSRSYQEVLSIPLDWSLGEYKFGASSSCFVKPGKNPTPKKAKSRSDLVWVPGTKSTSQWPCHWDNTFLSTSPPKSVWVNISATCIQKHNLSKKIPQNLL